MKETIDLSSTTAHIIVIKDGDTLLKLGGLNTLEIVDTACQLVSNAKALLRNVLRQAGREAFYADLLAETEEEARRILGITEEET